MRTDTIINDIMNEAGSLNYPTMVKMTQESSLPVLFNGKTKFDRVSVKEDVEVSRIKESFKNQAKNRGFSTLFSYSDEEADNYGFGFRTGSFTAENRFLFSDEGFITKTISVDKWFIDKTASTKQVDIIGDKLGAEVSDVEMLTRAFMKSEVLMDIICNYLIESRTALRIFNSWTNSEMTIGRTVVNCDLFTQRSLIEQVQKNIATGQLTDDERKIAIAIITRMFMAEVSPLNIVAKSRERLIIVPKDNTTFNFADCAMLLKANLLALHVQDFITRAEKTKYEELLHKGSRRDRLANVMEKRFVDLRASEHLALIRLRDIEIHWNIVRTLILIRVLELPTTFARLHSSIMNDSKLIALASLANLTIPALTETSSLAMAYSLNKTTEEAAQSVKFIYEAIFMSGLFEFRTLQDFKDAIEINQIYSANERRKIGLAIFKRWTTSSEIKVVGMSSKLCAPGFSIVDDKSHSEIQGVIQSSTTSFIKSYVARLRAMNEDTWSNINLEGWITNLTDSEALLLACSIDEGCLRVKLPKGMYNLEKPGPETRTLLSLPSIDEIMKTDYKFFWSYNTGDKLYSKPLKTNIPLTVHTSDVWEYLLSTDISKSAKKPFEYAGFELPKMSFNNEYSIPEIYAGSGLTYSFEIDIDYAEIKLKTRTSLRELFAFHRITSARTLRDPRLFAMLNELTEEFIITSILRRINEKEHLGGKLVDGFEESVKRREANRIFSLIKDTTNGLTLSEGFTNILISEFLVKFDRTMLEDDVLINSHLTTLVGNRLTIQVLLNLIIMFELIKPEIFNALLKLTASSELIDEAQLHKGINE